MKNKRTLFSFAGLIILFLLLGSSLINIYTDWLFFNELQYKSIFVKVLSVKLLLGLIYGVFSFAFIMINIIIASRTHFAPIELFLDDQTKVSLNIALLAKWIKPLTAVLAIAVSFYAGVLGSSVWNEFLLFQNRMNVGFSDPVFGKDIGFYLFNIPWFEAIKNFISFIIFITTFIVSFNYILRGGIIVQERNISADKRVKIHVGILAGSFIINMAFGFYLDQFQLLFSPHGIIFGAGYADIHARLYVLRALIALTVLSGVIFIIGIFKGSWKVMFAPLVFTALVYAAGFLVYPALLQKLKVTPNELDLEKPFIENHIKFTRFGYDLEGIKVSPFDVSYNLTAKDIERNNATIKNIRLWDDMPILRTYSQLQQIRTYYSFQDVDNDRYTINGEYMQVMLSPRELSYENLPSRSWINEKIVFTGSAFPWGPSAGYQKKVCPSSLSRISLRFLLRI